MTVCLGRHPWFSPRQNKTFPEGNVAAGTWSWSIIHRFLSLRMRSFTSTRGIALPVFHIQNLTYSFKYIKTEKNSLFPRERFTFIWFITAVNVLLHIRFIYYLVVCLYVHYTYFSTQSLNISKSICHVIKNLMTSQNTFYRTSLFLKLNNLQHVWQTY